MEQIRELWDRLTQPADAIRPDPRTQFQTFEGWGTSDEYSSDMAVDTFDSLDAASRGDSPDQRAFSRHVGGIAGRRQGPRAPGAKQQREHDAGHKTADVGEVGHAADAVDGNQTGDELQQEPEADDQPGREAGEEQDAEADQRAYARVRE